jgi:DNA-binding SARP family transcriptional activator
MHLHVLGSVEVHAPGGVVDIKGMKRSALLGTLALHSGQQVSTSRLIDTLWEQAPPRSATANIRTYVMQLRRLLDESCHGRVRVAGNSTGYRLEVDHDELDLLRFDRLATLGEDAAKRGDPERAIELLEQADRCWRGRPCDGVDLGEWARARVATIEDRRWTAMSCLVDSKLVVGDHAGLVARLREMLAERPLSERTWAQLMIVLDREGRRGDALATFARAREVLDTELGLRPGPELSDLQHRILSGGRATAAPTTAPSTAPVRPRCLPPTVPGLVGRRTQLTELVRELGGASVIASVSGAPGVGKTALVVATAHHLLPEFPDGQLYHRLGGTTAAPARPGAVLAEFLRALGVPPGDIPAADEERAALYRSVLAERRVLVVLDDAAGADQVRSLVPGGGGCRTLVSSRTRLTSLEGAHLVHLPALEHDESTRLLAHLVGRECVRRQPADADRIVLACAGSPMALRIVAARIAVQPGQRLAALADQVSAEGSRLDALAIGELSVRAAFESSYARLTGEARRAFRLWGLLGAGAVTAATVTSLVGGHAERVIEELARASLLLSDGGQVDDHLRYRLDPLLALYAAERADAERAPDSHFPHSARLKAVPDA